MSTTPRRMLLDLGALPADGGVLRGAAEIGALLGLDLVGIFVEDERIALLSGARELRLPAGGWAAAEPARILGEMAALADRARRRLEQEVAALGLTARFETLRGEPGRTLADRAAPRDVLALCLAAATDLACLPSGAARRAPQDAAASVLLLPPRLAHRRGDVVALAPRRADGLVETASALARAAGERMLLLDPYGGPPGPDRRPIAAAEAGAIADALAGRAARLIVLPQDAGEMAAIAERLAARLRIPVLLQRPD